MNTTRRSKFNCDQGGSRSSSRHLIPTSVARKSLQAAMALLLLHPTEVDAACTLRSKLTNDSSASFTGDSLTPVNVNSEFEMVDAGAVTTGCGTVTYAVTSIPSSLQTHLNYN
jgi:hypothetical protein